MIKVRGMTIKEFNDVLDEMHGVYPFKPETTRICDLNDPRFNVPRHVEIYTVDEKTGVDIVLSKDVPYKEEDYG